MAAEIQIFHRARENPEKTVKKAAANYQKILDKRRLWVYNDAVQRQNTTHNRTTNSKTVGFRSPFFHMQSRVMVSEGENFPKTSPNFTVWGGGNSKKSGKNKRFLLIFTRFWCGRQELKTSSKR